MRRLILVFVAFVFGLGLLLPACSAGQPSAPATGGQPSAKAAEPYKLGATMVMSGEQTDWTKKNLIASMDLAVEEINAKGGVAGHKLQMIYEDSKNDPKEGVAAMRKLVEMDKVPVVFTIFTFVTFAQAPIADETKTVLYAAAVQHPDLISKSPWTFRNGVTSPQEGQFVGKWSAANLNPKNSGVIVEDIEAVLIIEKNFNEAFTKGGGTVTGRETYKANDTDFRAQLTKVRAANPSSLTILGSTPAAKARIMKQAREMGWNVPIVAIRPLIDKDALAIAGSAAEGVKFNDIVLDPDFVKRFKDKYGYEPEGTGASYYDAVKLVAMGIEKGGYNAEGIAKAIPQIGEYNGALGKLVFNGNREATVDLKMMTLKNGQPTQ